MFMKFSAPMQHFLIVQRFHWAFVASGDENKDIAAAEVGYLPMN